MLKPRRLVIALVFLAGCGVQEHKEQRAVRETAEVTSSASHGDRVTTFPTVVEQETDPKTGITKTKISPPMQIESQGSMTVDGKQKSYWWDSDSDSYPLGVKLILLALGLLALGAVFWAFKRQSAAAEQAFGLADEALARQIKKRRERATESTDPQEIAHHGISIADLEAERGQLRAKKK